jgi:hypothetical protein
VRAFRIGHDIVFGSADRLGHDSRGATYRAGDRPSSNVSHARAWLVASHRRRGHLAALALVVVGCCLTVI